VENGKYISPRKMTECERANTDGTGLETLHTSTTGTPNGITLTWIVAKSTLRYHSSVEKIQRMNLMAQPGRCF
jgi:hypothetical protein